MFLNGGMIARPYRQGLRLRAQPAQAAETPVSLILRLQVSLNS